MSSHWDDHPDHPVADWQYEVANGDTRQSYAEWCASREEQAMETARDSWPRYRVGIQREEARTHVFELVAAPDADSARQLAMEMAHDFDFADAAAGDPTYSVVGLLRIDELHRGEKSAKITEFGHALQAKGFGATLKGRFAPSPLAGVKVRVYEAGVDAGYIYRTFRSASRDDIMRRVATVCRAAWDERAWTTDSDYVPPVPESDEEVISVYFRKIRGVDVTTLEWEEYDLDISLPCDLSVDLTVDASPCVVRRSSHGGVWLEGHIMEGGGDAVDALEGFVLALVAAGFPIHLPEFKAVLADFCEGLANHIDDE